MSNQVCMEHQQSGIVFPSQLQESTFTTATIDYQDHNLTSTAQSSFYGTTFSIFQHFFVPFSSEIFRLNTNKTDGCTKLTLLESFIEVRPTPEAKSEPMQRNSLATICNTRSTTDEADTRLAALGKEPEDKIRMHFSTFCFDKSLSIPGQLSLITGDQPVYMRKRLQCLFPWEFKDTVCMLGPLHIEQLLRWLTTFEETVNGRKHMTTLIFNSTGRVVCVFLLLLLLYYLFLFLVFCLYVFFVLFVWFVYLSLFCLFLCFLCF